MIRVCGMAATVALLLSGCGDPSPERMKRGDRLYAYYCQDCHQRSGLGPMLEQIPFTENSMRHHEVVLMIKHGYKQGHTLMPAFHQLSDEQADALAGFLIEQRLQQAKSRGQ